MTRDLKQYLYKKNTDEVLDAQFASASEWGKVKPGQTVLFWKNGLRWYAIPFAHVQRIFRRMEAMTARGCGRLVSYDSQKLVLIFHDGGSAELLLGDNMEAQAARLLQVLKETHPEINYGKEPIPCSEN